MARNIAVSNKIYEELVKNKKDNESFSEEISRFMGKRGSFMDLAGSWKMDAKESFEIKKRIKRLRKNTTDKIVRRLR